MSAPARTDWSWDAVPRRRIAPGVERQILHGDRMMVCRLTIAANTTTAAHQHQHEQITLIERGRVRFLVGSEERMCRAGDLVILPGGTWHGCTILDEESILIDIFSPIREDFLEAQHP